MKQIGRSLEVAFLVLVAVMYCRPAHAYVDMGTGSYILQISIAAAAGALFSLKMFWATLRERLTKRMSRDKTVPSIQTTERNAR